MKMPRNTDTGIGRLIAVLVCIAPLMIGDLAAQTSPPGPLSRPLTEAEKIQAGDLIIGQGYACEGVSSGTMIIESETRFQMDVSCFDVRYEVIITIKFPDPYPDHCPPKPGDPTPETESSRKVESDDDIPEECKPDLVLTITPLNRP